MKVATMKMRSTANGLEIQAPAKVNLFLEILGKRGDGYHELETVMSTVSRFDVLRFVHRSDEKITLKISTLNRLRYPTGEIPLDRRNLILQAFDLLRARFSSPTCCQQGFDVFLQKNIPTEAGLGGASSNAAAALVAGRKLWRLDCSDGELVELAAKIGSDVPFFLFGGTAVCRGRGEIVEPIRHNAGLPIVIGKPRIGLSTALVYQNLASHLAEERQRDAGSFIRSLTTDNPRRLAQSLFNRLQPVAAQLSDDVERMAKEFNRINCPGHILSGSGTSYYGVFPTSRVARRVAQTLSNRLPDTRIFYCQTLGPNLMTAA